MGPIIGRGIPLPPSLVLELPETMRQELKRPLGPVIQEDGIEEHLPPGTYLATVGDMTTATLLRRGHLPKLAIVDYQTKRVQDVEWEEVTRIEGAETVVVENPAATITSDLYNAIIDAWDREGNVRIVVEGEEDLATLPAILHAPGGATVIYGIPDMGLCLVHVDEVARGVVYDALKRLRSPIGPVHP